MIMNSYTILRKLDAVGRLVLPLDMRRDLCLEPGGCVRVTLDKQGAGLLLERSSSPRRCGRRWKPKPIPPWS